MTAQEAGYAAQRLDRRPQVRERRRDYPVIQGVVLLFSFVYVLVNLMIDLLYTLLDPRIRY